MAFLVLSMTADPSGSKASKNWRHHLYHPNDQPSNPHMAMGPEMLVPSGSGCAKKRLETNGHTAKSFAPGCQITQTSTHSVTYIHTVTYSYYDTWMCTTPTKKMEVGCIVQASFLGSNACRPFEKQRGFPQYLAYVIECMVHIDVSRTTCRFCTLNCQIHRIHI